MLIYRINQDCIAVYIIKNIDCAPCTQKTTMDKSIAERSGRSQDKEAAMDKLRRLGYF